MENKFERDTLRIPVLKDEATSSTQRKSRAAVHGKQANKVAPRIRLRPKEPQTDLEEEYVEVEEEVDQLIDDYDDDDVTKSLPPADSSHSSRSIGAVPKRKTQTKRKRRSDIKAGEVETGSHQTVEDLAPTISWFKASRSDKSSKTPKLDTQIVESIDDLAVPMRKLRVSNPRKPSNSGSKRSRKQNTTVHPPADETGMASEGCVGTGNSSPVTVPCEAHSPEPEAVTLLDSVQPAEGVNLEGVPLPVYPLPSKPFPVQPPPKIPTGFAPSVSLDRNTQKVRRWRVAQREVRGIAGGRWFVRTWVGTKDSDYAASDMSTKKLDEKPLLPRLVGLSVSGQSGKGSGKSKKKAASSLTASIPPSRSGSSVPDVPPPGTLRAPTKMRTIIGPPSNDGD